MLNAVAIDDEPIALEVVKALAAKIPFLQLKAVFASPFEAMAYLQQEKVDLLFLDIKMPDISGIEFLRALPDPPMVIFTTAYSEHAVQSFELDAIDYLLKPFSQARFLKACNKALQQYEYRNRERQGADGFKAVDGQGSPGPNIIFVKSGYEQIRIDLNEVLYVESNGNYVQFVLSQSKLLSRLTMAEAAALLPEPSFVRIHRSYIVGKKHVTKVDRNNVWLGKTSLPIGPAYAAELERLTR